MTVRPGASGPTSALGAAMLANRRVLITRPAHQAAEFAARLRELGAEPIVAPTIEIGPPPDLEAARDAVARAHEYDWVVFTSRNAVDAFFDRLAELAAARSVAADDGAAFGKARVAAIGPRTAAALATRGVRSDLVPGAHVGEAMAAELLARTAPGDRVLLYVARGARDVLHAMLRRQGLIVDVVAAYETRVVDDPQLAAKAERADIVTFTSSSAVSGFAHNVADAARLLETKIVAAIGPVTARTAREAGIRVDAVADAFTVEGLLRALTARER